MQKRSQQNKPLTLGMSNEYFWQMCLDLGNPGLYLIVLGIAITL
jgi:hypothetical protein